MGARTRKPAQPTEGGPIRQCAGCRQRASASRLLRLSVGPQSQLVADVYRRLQGRGAHVCPRPACLQQALERGTLARVFKEPVYGDAAAALWERAVQQLGIFRRGGHLNVGMDDTTRAVETRRVGAVVVAQDAAANTAEQIRFVAQRCGVPVTQVPATKQTLGAKLGREDVAVAGVDVGMAPGWLWLVEAAAALGEGPRQRGNPPQRGLDSSAVETVDRGA